MHKFLSHSCNTLDPESADWFYVPLYATCMCPPVRLTEGVRMAVFLLRIPETSIESLKKS